MTTPESTQANAAAADLSSVDQVRPSRLRVPVGEVLLAAGLVSEEQIEEALSIQQITRERIGTILIERGYLTETQLVRTLADQNHIRFLDLEDHVADRDTARLLPETFARKVCAVAVGWEEGRLLVAMGNPADVFALDDIHSLTGAEITPVMAVRGQVERVIDRAFRKGSLVERALEQATSEAADESPASTDATVTEDDEAPVIRFVNEVIGRAVHELASDIHIEPTRGELRIRYRVDGVLRDVMTVPRQLQSRVVSRLKILAEMDIADRRAPQDGRASVTVDGRRVDMRLVSFPTTNGESVVMRLLDKSGTVIDINELGFRPDVIKTYRECYQQSSGAILVTGPTGSGKSTSLYATLRELNAPERNIITIEDPVEYELDGIKQVQVEPKAGVTFASALKSLLRADPDIVLVGEVRDGDTARLAIDAALTGHLVLSSLHTKSAAATPARLVKMGIEPFLVTSAIQCVLAQRLARRLCDRCKQPATIPADVLARMGWTDEDAEAHQAGGFFAAVGCSTCGGSGYSGRFAVHEVMPVTHKVADAIAEWAPPPEVEKIAIKEGMVPLLRDGLLKAAKGLTTVEELHRIAS
jgi:type IV pilus assembly protein PilB